MLIFPVEVLVILIFIVIMAILVGINYVVNNVLQIVICIVGIIVFITVSVLLFKLFAKIYKRDKNIFFFISFISVSLFWLFGPLYFMQFEFLDKSNRYISLFGDNILFRYLIIPVVIGFLGSLALLLIAYKIKKKIVQSILCIFSAIYIITFTLFSANICTKSYSDAATKEIINESTKQCILLKNANIYYPSFSDQKYTIDGNVYALRDNNSIHRFPLLCPLKFSNDSFEKGDIVYVKSSTSLSDGEFVKVTDGIKSGFIEIDAIRVY